MFELMAVTKALADETRVRILMALRGGELCVCQLIELLGLAPSTVSKHISILKQARMVECRKEGRWVFYRLAEGAGPAASREALSWVLKSVANDWLIKDDSKRLKEILRIGRDELCALRRPE